MLNNIFCGYSAVQPILTRLDGNAQQSSVLGVCHFYHGNMQNNYSSKKRKA